MKPGLADDLPQVSESPGAVSIGEAIDLFEEAIVFFDSEARIVASNASFLKTFEAIREFVASGSTWDIFLLEAERHALLDAKVCKSLRLAEDLMLEGHIDPPAIEFSTDTRRAFAARLKAVSNGGFALVLSETYDHRAEADSDRLAELMTSKVLEACPANLTMSRIGDGQILYRTPAATELLGISRNMRDHFMHVEERADFITALLPDARVDDMRVTGRRRDGSAFAAALSARLIDYRDEEVVVAEMTDLTDELTMRAELERQKDLAFQSEKMSALGELLASVAHELNNPLSVVIGNAMMLGEEPLDESAMKRVSKLSAAADRCVKIVRTFLSMAREQPLELSPCNLGDLVETAIDAHKSHTDSSTPELLVSLSDRLPDVVVDEVQIVQVILNLLNNAEQAMADAAVGDQVRISAELAETKTLVHLTISDNGPGVPKEIHGRIFDPLFTTKSSGKGTGVGLAFCHRVLAAHGGSIQLDKSMEGGARFVLELPVERC